MPALLARTTNPTPHDAHLASVFAQHIRDGHPIATAAVLSGIGERTARRYIADGSAQAEMEQGSPSLFWQEFKQAEAEFVAKNLAYIHRDAGNKGGWAAAMTLLERRRPRDFGRNVQVEQHTTTLSVTVALPGLPEQELMALLQANIESGRKLLGPPPTPDTN